MPSFSFTATFAKNTGLLFSPQEIRTNYLYNIKIPSNFSNQASLNFSDDDIIFYIQAAQKELENYLGIKFQRQIYSETLEFSNDDWRHWGHVKTTYQVACPLRLEGFLNTTKVATYPREWLSSKKETGDELYHRSIYMVPAGNTGAVTNSVIFAGILPNLGYLNAGIIPNYWTTTYSTGFNKVPADIMNAVGMLAAINLLYIAGASVLGFPGATSTSLSIDGLSQSLAASANAFESRIKAYNEDLQRKLVLLTGTYRGFSWGVC